MPMSATLNPPTEVDIDRASAVPAPDDDTLIAWATAALDALGLHGVSLAVRLVDADEAQALNRDYRGKDYATNVLTFDYQREPVVVADLVLCAPVIEREAAELGLSSEERLAHLVVASRPDSGVAPSAALDELTANAQADRVTALHEARAGVREAAGRRAGRAPGLRRTAGGRPRAWRS